MLYAILGTLVSFIPAILLFVYLRNLRKADAEYGSDCRKLLVRGILCSVGVALIALVLDIVWSVLNIAPDSPLIKDAFRCFVLAAFVEELVKYLAGNSMIKKRLAKATWLDCIAYCCIVGIGFQMIETVVYLLEANVIQTLVRGFTMGHPAYGMLMGWLIGKSLFTGKKSYRVLALVIPIFIHGLYDFSLADSFGALNDNLVVVPFICIAVELGILIRMLFLIKKERKGTKYTQPLCPQAEEKANVSA